jgi:hypothetical protein
MVKGFKFIRMSTIYSGVRARLIGKQVKQGEACSYGIGNHEVPSPIMISVLFKAGLKNNPIGYGIDQVEEIRAGKIFPSPIQGSKDGVRTIWIKGLVAQDLTHNIPLRVAVPQYHSHLLPDLEFIKN